LVALRKTSHRNADDIGLITALESHAAQRQQETLVVLPRRPGTQRYVSLSVHRNLVLYLPRMCRIQRIAETAGTIKAKRLITDGGLFPACIISIAVYGFIIPTTKTRISNHRLTTATHLAQDHNRSMP